MFRLIISVVCLGFTIVAVSASVIPCGIVSSLWRRSPVSRKAAGKTTSHTTSNTRSVHIITYRRTCCLCISRVAISRISIVYCRASAAGTHI